MSAQAQLEVELISFARLFNHANARHVNDAALAIENALVLQRNDAPVAIDLEAAARVIEQIEARRVEPIVRRTAMSERFLAMMMGGLERIGWRGHAPPPSPFIANSACRTRLLSLQLDERTFTSVGRRPAL